MSTMSTMAPTPMYIGLHLPLFASNSCPANYPVRARSNGVSPHVPASTELFVGIDRASEDDAFSGNAELSDLGAVVTRTRLEYEHRSLDL